MARGKSWRAHASVLWLGALIGVFFGLILVLPKQSDAEPGAIRCSAPHVVDGDTLRCGGKRIRLAHIDAPEMPGHCRPGRRCTPGDPYAAQAYLEQLTRGAVICRAIDTDAYGRIVAFCVSGGQDIACAMVRSGNAVQRYGALNCPD